MNEQNHSDHMQQKQASKRRRKTWRISYTILRLLVVLNTKQAKIVRQTWWYFILSETVRFYPRLGWSVVNNSFCSGEGEKWTGKNVLNGKHQYRHRYGTMQNHSEIVRD